jgi:hypothetical protein
MLVGLLTVSGCFYRRFIMTETKEDKRPESPKDQLGRQAARDATGAEPAEGEPFHYSAPTNPNAGVTKSPPNEVIPDEYDADGNPIPKTAQPKGKTGESGTASEGLGHEDYEDMTVVELRELAADRGVAVRSDMNKAEIIQAIQKG